MDKMKDLLLVGSLYVTICSVGLVVLLCVLTLNACVSLPVNRVVEAADGDKIGPLYRVSDPEYGIVCYTIQAVGSSPAVSCVKR